MNPPPEHDFSAARRHCAIAVGCIAVLPTRAFADLHDAAGPVKPARPVPAIVVTTQEGRQRPLQSLLEGKVSALQLMFTGCSSICPIQGALFAAIEPALAGASLRDAQLLSVSIDPLGDSPAQLQTWRRKFSAGTNWLAAVPTDRDLPRLVSWIGNSSTDILDRHTTQILIVDRAARLTWRSTDLPAAREVLAVLRAVHNT
ncbi:MAG TPA: SCO family protein [Burkholderiaceae bacterium]|nr:SCO family protein [Burkholderiaceae bacterium]